jgi:four helix bundle protein
MNDLKARTFEFSVRVMKLADSLPSTRSGNTVANQLVRSGSSVGANYRSATRAKSSRDFVNKLAIVEEECDETIFWIEVALKRELVPSHTVADLLKEANEILAIMVASIKTAKERQK